MPQKPSRARSTAAAAKPPSSDRKAEAVVRVLAGESLETVAAEYQADVEDLEEWRGAFLSGGRTGLDTANAPERNGRLPAAVRRAQILEAARELFSADGLNGVGMRQVAKHAGVDPALVYHYFPSKRALFDEAVIEPMVEMVTSGVRGSEPFTAGPDEVKKDTIRQMVDQHIKVMEKAVPLLGAALFHDETSGRQFYQDRMYPLMAQSFGIVAEATKDWAEEPLDAEIAVLAMFGMYFGLSLHAHFGANRLDQRKVAQQLGEFMSRGLSGQPKSTRKAVSPKPKV